MVQGREGSTAARRRGGAIVLRRTRLCCLASRAARLANPIAFGHLLPCRLVARCSHRIWPSAALPFGCTVLSHLAICCPAVWLHGAIAHASPVSRQSLASLISPHLIASPDLVQEIELLREELDRLRRRTFPTFTHTDTGRGS